MIVLESDSCERVPFYCEENVWRLLARPELAGAETWAVIVSSMSRSVVLHRQKAGRGPLGIVDWDYHVFCIARDGERGLLALDLDSETPFPSPACLYLEATFPGAAKRGSEPLFRLLPGDFFVTRLASDRSHMISPDGDWLAPPPPWLPPGDQAEGNLMAWIDVGASAPGRILALEDLLVFASGGASAAIPGLAG